MFEVFDVRYFGVHSKTSFHFMTMSCIRSNSSQMSFLNCYKLLIGRLWFCVVVVVWGFAWSRMVEYSLGTNTKIPNFEHLEH